MALQSQGSPSPGFATLPQLLQELLALLLHKGNYLSKQPCSPSAGQRLQLPPRGSCSCTEGIQTLLEGPKQHPNRLLSQLEPRFYTSSKSNIPGFTPHIQGISQCLHAGAVPHRRFVFMASPPLY